MALRSEVLVLMTSPLDAISHSLSVIERFRSETSLVVTWVVRQEFASLLEQFECVDRIIPFERLGGFRSSIRLVRKLRAHSFDYVFDFEGHARTGLMLAFARSDRKLGKAEAREGATVFYKELVESPRDDSSHIVNTLLKFGHALGIDVRVPKMPVERKAYRRLPQTQSSMDGAICVFPGRFKEHRIWKFFPQCVVAMSERWPERQIILLGQRPVAWLSSLGEVDPGNIVDRQGELSWGEVLEVMSRASVVVAGDNGPSQLANCLGVPNVTLYGYVRPAKRGSYPVGASRNIVLAGNGGDVQGIEIDEVLQAVAKLLES